MYVCMYYIKAGVWTKARFSSLFFLFFSLFDFDFSSPYLSLLSSPFLSYPLPLSRSISSSSHSSNRIWIVHLVLFFSKKEENRKEGEEKKKKKKRGGGGFGVGGFGFGIRFCVLISIYATIRFIILWRIKALCCISRDIFSSLLSFLFLLPFPPSLFSFPFSSLFSSSLFSSSILSFLLLSFPSFSSMSSLLLHLK